MAKYQIASEATVFGKFGDTVDDDQLGGCNVSALLAAGHLAPVIEVSDPAKSATSKKENS